MIKQPILNELKYFVTTVSNIHRGIPPEISSQLVKCSLNLLEDLPAARDAVLEYFALVFDISVGNYVAFIEKEPNGTPPEEEAITNIQEALEELVANGPSQAWASLLSTWSLRLLGQLSDKHSRGRPIDIASACTLWLGSSAMRCLLGLSASCFGKLNSTETETCITVLLNTFIHHTPRFDWVVARLGGCFPIKVISKILQCGLKSFSSNFNNALDSEVGILGYLSFAHENDLVFALREMLESALTANKSATPNINTIPYLIHLSRMSEILLQPIINVFLIIFDESLIPTLVYQSAFFPSNYNVREIFILLTNLVIKVSKSGTKIILTLAHMAEKYQWCQEMLEHIMQELECLINDDRNCPLLCDFIKDESKKMLWKSCIVDNYIEQQTAVRIILLVSVRNPFFYHQTIAELLTTSSEINNNGLGALVRILGGCSGSIDCPEIKPGLEMALENVALQDKRNYAENYARNVSVIKNLTHIVKYEKSGNCPHLKRMPLTHNLQDCVSKILTILYNLLNKTTDEIELGTPFCLEGIESCEASNKKIKIECDEHFHVDINKSDRININSIKDQIHLLITLLDMLEVGGKNSVLNIVDVLKLAQMTVKYFFWSLTEKSPTVRLVAVNRVYSHLTRQCSVRKAARTAALRDLLEGALFLYTNLFGEIIETDKEDKVKRDDLLITLNQKQGVTAATNRSVLHAGIIGQGLKLPAKEANSPSAEIQKMYLDAITACCNDWERANVIDGFSTVSLLLVEMVSPDVMYNGLPWPDEDFTKVTMERDLQIRRAFKNTPILWSILGLVASHRPALCYASVLLRALCASALHQWRARSVEKPFLSVNNPELLFFTLKLLEIMAQGQLLPPPLNYLHVVIEYFEPCEIALLLKDCVWNYMKDHVPSPVLFNCDSTGLHWRNPELAKPPPQFTDPLRYIMLKRLPILGGLYHQMFVLANSDDMPIKIDE